MTILVLDHHEVVACGCVVERDDEHEVIIVACPQHDPGPEIDQQVQRALDLELAFFLKRGRHR